MTAEVTQIQEWLQSLFGEKPIPQYEISEENLDHLRKLMESNKNRNLVVKNHIDDLKQNAAMYNVNGDKLNDRLQRLGIDQSTMSVEAANSIKTLTRLGQILNLDRCTQSSYMLGLRDISKQLWNIHQEGRAVNQISQKLRHKHQDLLRLHSNLKRTLQDAENTSKEWESSKDSQAKNIEFLDKKSTQYQNELYKYNEQLRKVNAEPSIYHSTIVEKSEELKELQEKLMPLKSELKAYKGLPLDTSLIKVELENLKQRKEELELQLQESLNSLESSSSKR